MFSNTVGSQLSVVPKGLPLLPGNGFKDPTLTDFKKSHVFDVHQGIPVSHDPTVAAPPATAGVYRRVLGLFGYRRPRGEGVWGRRRQLQ